MDTGVGNGFGLAAWEGGKLDRYCLLFCPLYFFLLLTAVCQLLLLNGQN